ncbi:MAG: carotenoid biosynthesis protein [Roseiflexaceae bacterium]|nr:carotenoid biosynthesis protein [Roseiflexaceae bacterium]
MPAPLFLLFELGVYCLAAICLRHAWVRGRIYVVGLILGMIYGVLLEYMAIVTLQAYDYGQFLIMIAGTVPLCIGVSWGLILYTAMATSDCFGIAWYLRPIIDALLALTIDLSMDAIAIRLGFWTWRSAGAWFGVPLGNFYAWFVVVAGFSLLLRLGLLSSYAGRLRFLADLAVAIIAVPLILFGLTSIIWPSFALVAQGNVAWLITGLLLGGSVLLAIWAARHTPRDQPFDWVLLCVPACFHLFFFGALFWAGINRQVPLLIPISALMFGIGLALHWWPMGDRSS